MLDWLRGRHGVDEVTLSCGFLSDRVRSVLGDIHEGMRLRYVVEPEPLGTAGPVRLALDQGLLAERLLVLNGDVLTDMDLGAEVESHMRSGAAATLALTAVQDTASYGVVPTDEQGRVEAFLEKSAEPAPTNRINAGAYVLQRSVVEEIPAGRAVSFEHEVFPGLVGKGLYGWPAEGYWVDIGSPERYMEATWDLLSGRVESRLAPRDQTGSLVGEGCLTAGRPHRPAGGARLLLLGGQRLSGRALGPFTMAWWWAPTAPSGRACWPSGCTSATARGWTRDRSWGRPPASSPAPWWRPAPAWSQESG